MHLSSKGLFEEKTIDAMKSVNYIVSFEIISAMVKKKNWSGQWESAEQGIGKGWIFTSGCQCWTIKKWWHLSQDPRKVHELGTWAFEGTSTQRLWEHRQGSRCHCRGMSGGSGGTGTWRPCASDPTRPCALAEKSSCCRAFDRRVLWLGS